MANAPAAPSGGIFACTYGSSGSGKSVDHLYSFPTALFIAEPGALKPAFSVCGYRPHVVIAKNIQEATDIIRKNEGKFETIVVDDFTLLCDKTFAVYEKSKTGFTLWGSIRDDLLDFREAVRVSGKCHVVLNAHLGIPHMSGQDNKQKYVRGGPKLPGTMTEDFPPGLDMCIRVIMPQMAHPLQTMVWNYAYSVDSNDSSNITKDRLNVVSETVPMNLAEIFRAAGYRITRHPSMPWQEDAVTQVAQAITAVVEAQIAAQMAQAGAPGVPPVALPNENPMQAYIDIFKKVKTNLVAKAKATDMQVQWTFRDAVSRVLIQRTLAMKRNRFGV